MAAEEPGQRRRIVGLHERGQRGLEPALGLEPAGRRVVEVADLGRRQRQPGQRVLADQPVQREPAGLARQRLEEQRPLRELLERVGRVRHADRPQQRRREPVEVDRAPDQRPGVVGGVRDDLLGEVGEDRALRTLETIEDRLAVAAGRVPIRLEREADGRRPAAGRDVDPRRRDVVQVGVIAVVAEQGMEQLVDLVGREGERGPTQVEHLALAPQPLDRERDLRPGRDEDVEPGRSEPDERLDEAERARRPGEDVEVVEDEHQVLVERGLERVDDERGRGRGLGDDRRVVGRLDRALDRVRGVVGDRGQADAQRGGDPGRERADVAVGGVERVPGRRAGGGDAGGERRLPEAGAADDDREPALRAVEQPRLELGSGERPDRIRRRQQLRRPPAARARDLVARRRRRPGCFGRRLRDGVGVGGHRDPLRTVAMVRAASTRGHRLSADAVADAHQDGQGLQSAKTT